MLHFLLPLPASPSLGDAVELGRADSGLASGLGGRLGRGRSGVLIGRLANRGEELVEGLAARLLLVNQCFLYLILNKWFEFGSLECPSTE